MAFDQQAFNCDSFIERDVLKLKEQHRIDIAIETGSYHGMTTEWLAKNFKAVMSCEINPDFAKIAKKRVEKYDNTIIFPYDSIKFLDIVLPSVSNRRVLFFLDAHWYDNNPLLGELKMIARHMKVPPVIAIHDFFNPNHPEYGFDEYPDQSIIYNIDYIRDGIDLIYPHPNISYNEEAEGAKRGIIYLSP